MEGSKIKLTASGSSLNGKEEAEFLTSIRANIPKPNPDSIHLRLDIADDLIGIAGFTEIAWINRMPKLTFSGSTENS